jgi:hypothetical protein
MLYEKCENNSAKWNKFEIKGIFWEIKQIAACLKHAVNILPV